MIVTEMDDGKVETRKHYLRSGWWFGTFVIFPYIGLLIIPFDFHIVQRGG